MEGFLKETFLPGCAGRQTGMTGWVVFVAPAGSAATKWSLREVPGFRDEEWAVFVSPSGNDGVQVPWMDKG